MGILAANVIVSPIEYVYYILVSSNSFGLGVAAKISKKSNTLVNSFHTSPDISQQSQATHSLG